MVLLRASMLRAVLIVSVASLASACDVGEVDIGGGMMVDAQTVSMAKSMAFTATIKPIADAKNCTSAGCHGGVTPPVMTTFTALLPKYYTGPSATNVMITKDVVAGTATGTHSGLPYFSAAEKTMVAAWIDMP